MKYEVRKDRKEQDFEISDFRKVSSRGAVLAVVLGLAALFLVSAGIYGWWHGEFSGLQKVADYIRDPMWLIVGYFFGVKYEQGNNNSGSNGDARSSL